MAAFPALAAVAAPFATLAAVAAKSLSCVSVIVLIKWEDLGMGGGRIYLLYQLWRRLGERLLLLERPG